MYSFQGFLDTIRPFSKAIAAIAGVTIFVLFKRWGVEVPGLDSVVLDLITGALIVGGTVYQAPANTPPAPKTKPGK